MKSYLIPNFKLTSTFLPVNIFSLSLKTDQFLILQPKYFWKPSSLHPSHCPSPSCQPPDCEPLKTLLRGSWLVYNPSQSPQHHPNVNQQTCINRDYTNDISGEWHRWVFQPQSFTWICPVCSLSTSTISPFTFYCSFRTAQVLPVECARP